MMNSMSSIMPKRYSIDKKFVANQNDHSETMFDQDEIHDMVKHMDNSIGSTGMGGSGLSYSTRRRQDATPLTDNELFKEIDHLGGSNLNIFNDDRLYKSDDDNDDDGDGDSVDGKDDMDDDRTHVRRNSHTKHTKKHKKHAPNSQLPLKQTDNFLYNRAWDLKTAFYRHRCNTWRGCLLLVLGLVFVGVGILLCFPTAMQHMGVTVRFHHPNTANAAFSSDADTPTAEGMARNALVPPKTSPRPVVNPNLLLDRLIIVPEYKLLFCYIEKAGCSMFNNLFRILRMLHPSVHDDIYELGWLAQGTWFRNTPQHFHLDHMQLEQYMIDPNWTKAVFFRDPASRLVTAFRSKCSGLDGDAIDQCDPVFGPKAYTQYKGSPEAFQQAMYKMINNQNVSITSPEVYFHYEKAMHNPHFTHQSNFCGGLQSLLDYYNVVHQLKPSTSVQDVHALLQRIGVPDDIWNDYLHELVATGAGNGETLVPRITAATGVELHDFHPADHTDTTAVLHEYLDSTTLATIHELYNKDYELFHLAKLKVLELQKWLGK